MFTQGLIVHTREATCENRFSGPVNKKLLVVKISLPIFVQTVMKNKKAPCLPFLLSSGSRLLYISGFLHCKIKLMRLLLVPPVVQHAIS